MQSVPLSAAASTSSTRASTTMEAPHQHCASCVNLRCTTKPTAGASCDLTACPLACGATFHSCKSAEHRLLCPLERVPCLNSGFGCPITLARHRMAPHLEVCPAGLVCCTMEWNRWPVSCLDYTSQLSGGGSSGGGGGEEPEQLDMALALQDQRMLLESLKVVAMAPTTRWEPAVVARTKVRGVARTDSPGSAPEASSPSPCEGLPRPSPGVAPPLPPGSAQERIANGIDGLIEEHYGQLYEATLETARSLAAALDVLRAANGATECGAPLTPRGEGAGGGQRGGESGEAGAGGGGGKLTNGLHVAQEASAAVDDDDGVQEWCLRHGCLTSSARHLGAQSPGEPSPGTPHAATPGIVAKRAGHVTLEDGELAVSEDGGGGGGTEHRLLNKPPGFRHVVGPLASAAGRRGPPAAPLPDRPRPPPLEDRAVDTSDLQQGADDLTGLGEMDPVAAALLFCLEESRECRRISDTARAADGRRVDAGTQTFTFPGAVLVTGTRVGEMASASACDHAAHQLSCPRPLRTLRLGLALESLEVEVPHGRFLPFQPPYQHTFSFLCGQAFRRDQFSWHSANVHADIHAGLSGWMEHRCPLAYYGCTFSQRRLGPAGRGAGVGAAESARVVHDGRLQSFGVRPCLGSPPLQAGPPSDQLTGLPMEILWHIAGFLDSFSLCQLSVVSRGMRDVCSSLLQTRGVVDLQWERRLDPRGTICWHVKNKVWRFSTAFSAVTKWRFSDLPSMSDHLRECRFNTPDPQTEPVPLPAMCTARDRQSLRRLLRPVNNK